MELELSAKTLEIGEATKRANALAAKVRAAVGR